MVHSLSKAELSELKISLAGIVGDRVTDGLSVRQHHAHDEGYHAACAPDLVATPHNTGEVAQIVSACAAADCAIVPWGAGTSLEGNALAVNGGVCIDLSQMTEILSMRPEDFRVTVQAGVRRIQLNTSLRSTGLFFPIDPGADATLGGMAATRASGTNAVRYGTMRDNVLGCTVVLADGRVVRTARSAPKSAAGYDLTALLVGSEGTLGIITEVTLRIYPVPDHTFAAVCVFDEVGEAVKASMATIQYGLAVARIEFLDAPMIAAINRFERAGYPESPTLFLEFHGMESQVKEQFALFEDICAAHRGRIAASASSPEERSALWRARHNALYATRALVPNRRVLITDVCVPVSRLADCLLKAREYLDGSSLRSTIAGHVGDGNFHAFILVDPERPQEIEEAETLHHRMARLAISMDGTCTGEHGVGLGKRDLLREELADAVPVMAAVKAALDPRNIMNPGKILP